MLSLLLAFCSQSVSFQTRSQHFIGVHHFTLIFQFSLNSGIHKFITTSVCKFSDQGLKKEHQQFPYQSHFQSSQVMQQAAESPLPNFHCSALRSDTQLETSVDIFVGWSLSQILEPHYQQTSKMESFQLLKKSDCLSRGFLDQMECLICPSLIVPGEVFIPFP